MPDGGCPGSTLARPEQPPSETPSPFGPDFTPLGRQAAIRDTGP